MTALFAVGSWTARAPNEWDVVFDISSIPIEEEIELNLQVKECVSKPIPNGGEDFAYCTRRRLRHIQ
jgi:hypothetical protein